jgi:hypothetical protein
VISSGLASWKRSYQISPIIFVAGVAAGVPGGQVPIINFTEANEFNAGILSQGGDLDLDSFFATYVPMAGGTLIENEVSTYPFANQTVAANAIITQPLRISLRMLAPVRNAGGYQQKLTVFQNLQSTIEQHIINGGWFNVATPAFFYNNCLLTALRDVTGNEGKQTQIIWQWDFMQPLLTEDQAAAQQSVSMAKISAQGQLSGDPPPTSGNTPNVGADTSTVIGSVLPSASSLAATAFSGLPGAIAGPSQAAFAGSMATGIIGPSPLISKGFSTP